MNRGRPLPRPEYADDAAAVLAIRYGQVFDDAAGCRIAKQPLRSIVLTGLPLDHLVDIGRLRAVPLQRDSAERLLECASTLFARTDVGQVTVGEVDYRAGFRRALIMEWRKSMLVDRDGVKSPAAQVRPLYHPSRTYGQTRANEALKVIHRKANWHPNAAGSQFKWEECHYFFAILHDCHPCIVLVSTDRLGVGKRQKRI